MNESEKLILSEIKSLRGEINKAFVRVHQRIDKTEEKVHNVDKQSFANKVKLTAYIGAISCGVVLVAKII